MTFQEMLELVDGKVPLVIELKPFGGYKDIVKKSIDSFNSTKENL